MGLLSNLNLGDSLTNIQSAVQQYVVAPLAAFGIGGFVFNAQGEGVANLSADISDHYAEDNTSLQDQIAIRPKHITLKGYVGEVIYNGSGDDNSALNTLAQKLTELSSLQPPPIVSVTQIQGFLTNPATATFSSVLGTASNIYGLVQNALGSFGDMKNQQNAYNYFRALMESKTLMGVQTPWAFMTNMAIESVVALQPEKSQWITDFSVTFKQMNFAQTSTVALLSNASAGIGQISASLSDICDIQEAPVTNLGNITGAPADTSILTGS